MNWILLTVTPSGVVNRTVFPNEKEARDAAHLALYDVMPSEIEKLAQRESSYCGTRSIGVAPHLGEWIQHMPWGGYRARSAHDVKVAEVYPEYQLG